MLDLRAKTCTIILRPIRRLVGMVYMCKNIFKTLKTLVMHLQDDVKVVHSLLKSKSEMHNLKTDVKVA